MRGYTRLPGLVAGEPCVVRVQPLPEKAETLGPTMPSALFERDFTASVVAQGGRNVDGSIDASALLSDPWLERDTTPRLLRNLHGREVPAPFRYEVTPLSYLKGWTREAELHVGDVCHIWIRPHGEIPWLDPETMRPAPDTKPVALPTRYPKAELIGFWEARITAIVKPRPDTPLRRLRAVFRDPRILHHANPRVRELYGHEPWMRYVATRSETETLAAASELIATAGEAASDALAKTPIPEWLRRARLSLDDFLG